MGSCHQATVGLQVACAPVRERMCILVRVCMCIYVCACLSVCVRMC